MLSRTAENLYWTGRYVERAENTARILDVSLRSALQRGSEREEVEWESVVDLVGERPLFASTYESAQADTVTVFAILDSANPSSIHSSVRAARENLRALRAAVSNELWENINATWLMVRDFDEGTLRERGVRELCEWTIERAHLFQGISSGTTLRDDAFHFLLLGTFLERADNTARLLRAKYLQFKETDAGPASAYYGWGSVLRALSAFRSYHQTFRDVIAVDRVTELLVLRREMPRSLRFCAQEALGHLDHLGKSRDLECQRLAGELHARLRFGRMDRILEAGLPEFLAEIVESIAALSNQISRDFLMTV
ncbi:MAG TPA: alpha-E domain-containing protein [Polyangiaceae bacterium]|nr:alpha-E domain-containing protein [Polyangiaceae bacterium]